MESHWLVILGVLATILCAASSNQLASEFRAWAPRLADRLVERAASYVTEDVRALYEEYWKREVAAVPGEVGKIVKALIIRFSVRSPTFWGSIRDRCLAALLIVFLLPLMLLIGLATKLDGGPVFVRHLRRGLDNRNISVVMFRTAPPGGTEGLTFTRVGRFLRKGALHELPQLLNVLRGEMRIVGPPLDIERGSG